MLSGQKVRWQDVQNGFRRAAAPGAERLHDKGTVETGFGFEHYGISMVAVLTGADETDDAISPSAVQMTTGSRMVLSRAATKNS